MSDHHHTAYDRRRHQRVAVNHEFVPIDDYIAEYVTSISPGGVFIRSRNPLPVGTRVDLRFSVILEDIHHIEGKGEVVRVQPTDPQGMGVAFTRLSATSKAIIDRIVGDDPQ